MATVLELSAPYANLMLGPAPGAGVCSRCFNLTDGYDHCYACTRHEHALDAIAPISYSVAHEQLHHALASYKRLSGPAGDRLTMQLAAVLWRYLEAHEPCVARCAGVAAFPIVATVPSSDRARDEEHPLRRMVAEMVAVTRDRHQRLLRRSDLEVSPRTSTPDKYIVQRELSGEAILLIDDTWTTGANAQSAATALKLAGAGPVAAVVIGRHLNRDWGGNDTRLRRLPTPFDWDSCVLCRRCGGR